VARKRAGSEDREPEQFPAPFRDLPFPPPGSDVVFYRTEPDAAEAREFEDIMLRRVPRAVASQFRGAAGARGLTHAQYLASLVALHAAMRQRADAGDAAVAAALDELGLRTVSI
jgi:hypothetical protein